MFEIGTATSASDLLNKLNTFLTTNGSAFGLAFTGVGDGTFTSYRGGASSVAETFTITATDPTTFSVVGSVSGSIGTATAGTPFSHAKLAFTITAGATPFQAGDAFVISTAPKWVADRANASDEYIWHAPGNDGVSAIYCGAKYFYNASADYYNLRMGAFISYDAGLSFAAQNGVTRPILTLWQNSIPYWFVCNGRRAIIVAKVSTVYVAAYIGFIQPYATPGEWAYPIAVCANLANNTEPADTSTGWRWSATGNTNCNFPMVLSSGTDNNSQLRLRLPDGNFIGFTAYNEGLPYYSIHPYKYGIDTLKANLDGSIPILPILLYSDVGTFNTYGKFDGVFFVSGAGLSSETELNQQVRKYIVFQNVYRADSRNYFAVELD